jgi:quercetin dioxygenase-like cupin family protein
MKPGNMRDNEHIKWVALYSVGALPAEERISFEEHLTSGCITCAAELEKLEGVVSGLANFSASAPPPLLRERLLAAVRHDGGSSADEGSHPGVLFQQAGLLISRAGEIAWEPVGIPGIRCKTLFVDSRRQYTTSLISMEPGANYPSHRHNDIEEVYLLDGDLVVEDVNMRPGDYCRSEPGSIHGAARTTSGVLLLVFSSQRDELLT